MRKEKQNNESPWKSRRKKRSDKEARCALMVFFVGFISGFCSLTCLYFFFLFLSSRSTHLNTHLYAFIIKQIRSPKWKWNFMNVIRNAFEANQNNLKKKISNVNDNNTKTTKQTHPFQRWKKCRDSGRHGILHINNTLTKF